LLHASAMKTTDKNTKSIVNAIDAIDTATDLIPNALLSIVDVAMKVVSEAKTIINDTETIDFICKINNIGFVMINIVALTIIIDAIQPALIQQPGGIPDFDDYHCDGDNHFDRKVDSLFFDFNLHRDDRNLLPRGEHRHPFPDDLHPRGSNRLREVHELIRRSDDSHCDGYQSLCDADD
jgi:hypothetical protein